ncbi:hypothetical protein O3W52_03110 [Ensifer psoraleae]|uniref:Uncharacterized protein n=2 Tax=Sinorhizobium psoraleae TaxID=520838 RepID=A0ABT4KCJ2_9HYPH|nr:hypothetical protein [Sinorhizobium psoraleae]
MAKFPVKGEVATLHADVVRVWENNTVTLHIHGYPHPITIDVKHLVSVEPKPKDKPKPKAKRGPLIDKPD